MGRFWKTKNRASFIVRSFISCCLYIGYDYIIFCKTSKSYPQKLKQQKLEVRLLGFFKLTNPICYLYELKLIILKATNGQPARSVIATGRVHTSRVKDGPYAPNTINGTRPVVAATAHITKPSTTVVAVAT